MWRIGAADGRARGWAGGAMRRRWRRHIAGLWITAGGDRGRGSRLGVGLLVSSFVVRPCLGFRVVGVGLAVGGGGGAASAAGG